MELYNLLIIIHLFGIALGAGGAFASDMIFLTSVKDKSISSTEFTFIKLASRIVWSGLAILVLSGIMLFSLDPSRLGSSSKFQAKMTIVSVIIINGIIFHAFHIPRIKRHQNEHFPSSDEFVRHRTLLTASGALSVTSWFSALLLGGWRSFPFSYTETIVVYGAVALSAMGIAFLIRHKVVPHHKE